MTIALGIDTGGTYTDAVLVELDDEQSHVIAGAKALTTRRDLAIGIGKAVEAVFSGGRSGRTRSGWSPSRRPWRPTLSSKGRGARSASC
jgi:N-methylhydantoinase A/oxoprolinase/acetone carboxylase beta subunit